ncbi:MAG: GNAT family N-acetyltransferase [Acetatifactor sp.]|nr:GNAT family N-acetyltransferase [Acetatifactor sp.]
MNLEIHFDRMEEAVSVMREVAAWGRSKGYRVWPEEWLTPEELITEDAGPENFCIGTVDGETACAFILQWKDLEYWPIAPEHEAAYLHKICVRRRFAGLGMAKAIADAVKEECRRRGIRYIHLDTALDEKKVRKIYLNAGFKIVDIIDHSNGRSMSLYEMETYRGSSD